MIEALSFTNWSMGESADVYDLPIPRARESCLGAWINGGHQRILHWFLRLGVPCYIIHQYRDGVDFGNGIPECRSRHSTDSFCPPSVWHLRSDVNAYETVACRHNTPWLTEPHPVVSGPNVTSAPDALRRSSSHFQGFSRPSSELFQQPEPEDGDIIWPSIVLFPNRIPWVKPPPIVVAAKKRGWSRFSAVTLDVEEDHPLSGREVMQERGRNYIGHDAARGPYFDRENKRKLYFSSLSLVTGLVSDAAYGRPVPFYHFVGPASSKGTPKTVPRSLWMYASEAPKSSEIGNEAPLPDADSLEVYPPTTTVSDPYNDLEDDDDEDGFPNLAAAPPVTMPPSPPRSENMEPLHEDQNIEEDVTPIVVSYRPPPVLCSSSLSGSGAPAPADLGELFLYVNYTFTHRIPSRCRIR
jgi:hypothetical protein